MCSLKRCDRSSNAVDNASERIFVPNKRKLKVFNIVTGKIDQQR